jgi:hypothetical protein
MLAVPVDARLSVVAAANHFAQPTQPMWKVIGPSARLSLHSWLRPGSTVSGNLSQRRLARHARRDGGILSLQAHCLPGWRRQDFRLAQPVAATLRRFCDPGFVRALQRISAQISKRFSFAAVRSVDSPFRPRSSYPRVARVVADPLLKKSGATSSPFLRNCYGR